jgi:hypothetical protein
MRSKSSDMPLKSFAKIFTYGLGKDFCPLSKLISTGNNKLPNTTVIFNFSSAHNCPSLKLGLCRAYDPNGKHICYARKSERGLYPAVEPRRNKQEEYWLGCTAEEFASQIILMNSLKELPWTHLRFSEAGDFHSQECVDKAEKIAMYLKRCGIITYGYTCRIDLDYSKVKHLIVSGTGFKTEGVSNIFTMVEDIKDRSKGWGVCCGDCSVCNRCMVRGNQTVIKRH